MTWQRVYGDHRPEVNGQRMFVCACRGCRNDRRNFHSWGTTLETFQAGHYFDRDTMRAFRSRVLFTDVSPVWGDVFVGVSSGNSYDGERIYELVRLCPFGELVRSAVNLEGPLDRQRYATSKALHKARNKRWEGWADCDCHGCTLDREYPERTGQA